MSFALSAIDAGAGDPSPFDPVRRGVSVVLGPPQELFGTAVSEIRGRTSDVDVEQLQRENASLRRELSRQQASERRLAEWEGLLQLADPDDDVVPARVVAAGPGFGFDRTVTIDAGRRDGIREEQPVLAGPGLLGRVVSVGEWSSVVLVLTDPEFGVGARLGGAGTLGIARGTGEGTLTYVPVQAARVPPDDTLLTAGSQTFPPDLPVGRVVAVEQAPGGLTAQARVEPFVDAATVEVVGVVTSTARTTVRHPVS